jgi:hypothetical protein
MLFKRHYFAILNLFSFLIKIQVLQDSHRNDNGDDDNAFLKTETQDEEEHDKFTKM